MSDIQDEAYTELCLENERLKGRIDVRDAVIAKLSGTVAAREIAQCYDDLRARDAQIERLKREIAKLKEAFANTSYIAEKSFEDALLAKDTEIDQLKAELSEWMSTNQRLHTELMEAQAELDALSNVAADPAIRIRFS
jgi:chromosome segregation ATPase